MPTLVDDHLKKGKNNKLKKTKLHKKTKPKGVAGKFDNRYFKKIGERSRIAHAMLVDIDNTDDFMGFILDLPANYYKDLRVRQKKEVFELLIEYLETNKIIYNRKPKIHTYVLIGLTSVARLLEIKPLFKDITLFFSRQILGQKLLPSTKKIIFEFAELVHPEDQIVMETFKTISNRETQIVDIFNKFINWSIENGENIDVLKGLFDMGFGIKDKLLTNASHFGNLEIVKYLVETHNLDVNFVNITTTDNKKVPSTGNPLYNAVEQNHIDIAEYLIEKGSDMDEYGGRESEENYTPIFEAIRNRNFDMVKLLIEKGAYLKHKTYTGIGLDLFIDAERSFLEDEEISEEEMVQVEEIYEYIEERL